MKHDGRGRAGHQHLFNTPSSSVLNYEGLYESEIDTPDCPSVHTAQAAGLA